MANIQALQDFVDAVNDSINQLINIRELLAATDILWPSLNVGAKTNIHDQVSIALDSAKASVAALQVP